MKCYKKFKDTFGLNAFGEIDFPRKISNVRISRIRNTDSRGGCSFCFPHGWETTNAKWDKNQRNWKKYRRSQWKQK